MARRSKRANGVDWRTIIRRIKMGKCTPIISYQVSSNHFTEQDRIVENWANEIGYPMTDAGDLPRVAQYASITGRDMLIAKEDYLDFLKERLLGKSRDEYPPEQKAFLDTLEDELYDLTLSEVAARLGYPRYENELDDPLRILAELPLPIYLTTNYATFMENALKAAGKEPRSDVCGWYEALEIGAGSVFERDPDYQPSAEAPLVYHLHGLDRHPSSLVLTEDDYLDFLVNTSQDVDAIPPRIRQALTDSSLLLLGYQLRGWDFRVILRGLITSRRASRRLFSLAIQLTPAAEEVQDDQEVRRYLKQYFQNLNFDIYWGDTRSFMQTLWEEWQE